MHVICVLPPVHASVPAAPLPMDEFDLAANLKSDQHFSVFFYDSAPKYCLRVVRILEFRGAGRLTSLDEEYLVALDLLCCELVSLYASEDIVAAAIFRHLILCLVCIRQTAITIEWFTIS